MFKELHKLWKHHAIHLKELCQSENPTEQIHSNNTKFEIGQPVMVKNHMSYFQTKIFIGLQGTKNT